MKKRTLSLLMALVCVVALASCDKTDGGDKEEVKNYTLNDFMAAAPTNWNPHTWETNADNTIAAYCEMGLVDIIYESEGKYAWSYEMATAIEDVTAEYAADPALAAKWNVEQDQTGRVWKLVLNPEAEWQNGTKINADTYVYSMKQLLSSEMKNYRANNYYSGDAAIYNGKAYFLNDQVGKPKYDAVQLTDEGYTVPADGKYYINADEVCIFFGDGGLNTYGEQYRWAYAPLVAVQEYVGAGYVEVTEEIKTKLLAVAALFGDNNPEAWHEFCFVQNGLIEETKWEDVGFFKTGEYECTYVTVDPISEYYFKIAMTSNFIVYEPMYEGNKSTVDNLVSTAYGTSLDTYQSYGPYKLVSFENDKQIVYEKNNNFYGHNKDVYQTTKIVVEILSDHNTALQKFELGELDGVDLEATDLNKYRFSDYLLKTDTTYTFRYVLNCDEEKLTALQNSASSSSKSVNKVVLANTDFRNAMSLAINRADYATKGTPGHKAAYYLLNYLYYYNVEEDPESVYRNTEEAMKVVLDLYNVKYDETSDIKALYNSVTGYDLAQAKALFQKAYTDMKAAGKFSDDQVIEINCMATGASSLSAEDLTQQNLLQDYFDAATKGTGFEDKITITFQAGSSTRYADIASGTLDMIRGAWGGAAFYPFSAIRCYTEPDYADIHEATGYDPTKVTLDITFDFDGDGKEEVVTKTIQGWAKSINGGGQYDFADFSVKLHILSQLEYFVLSNYYCIPVSSETTVQLYSKQIKYITTNYNIMYGYGGVRFLTYNYDDAEWASYVASQGGKVSYE